MYFGVKIYLEYLYLRIPSGKFRKVQKIWENLSSFWQDI